MDDNILLGALPLQKYVSVLIKERVGLVINVTHEFDSSQNNYSKHGIKVIQLNVIDFCAPSLSQIEFAVDQINKFIKNNPKSCVYVHCKVNIFI